MPEGTKVKRASQVRIVLTPQWCKGCGICIKLCPKQCFSAEEGTEKVILSAAERCVDCGLCELWCPDYAISLERGAGG